MIKKYITVLFIVCTFVAQNIYGIIPNRDSEIYFDYESAEFSKMETLKTWVKTSYHKNTQIMSTIQHFVATMLPQFPYSEEIKFISDDEEPNQFFGSTDYTIKDFELPFLQFVHEISTNKEVTTLEIAAADGYISFKVPLAFEKGGKHYVNELSSKLIKNFDENVDRVYSSIPQKEKLYNSIVKIPGDCFDILNKHPELKGKVDAIYIQHLVHFFNPEKQQLFLKLIEELLAPGGQAFICFNSPDFADTVIYKKSVDTVLSLYNKQKESGDKYPGFVQHDKHFIGFIDDNDEYRVVIIYRSNVIRPKDNTNINEIEIKDTTSSPYPLNDYEKICYEKTCSRFIYRRVINNFTPESYSNLIKDFPTLQVKDAFYINYDNGIRIDAWKHRSVVAVIIKKAGDICKQD